MTRDVHSCIHWLRPRNPCIGTRALFFRKERRHLFVIPRPGRSVPRMLLGFYTVPAQVECLVKNLTKLIGIYVFHSFILFNPDNPHCKKGYRFSRPQPGCQDVKSRLGTGKSLTFFYSDAYGTPIHQPSYEDGWRDLD
jgi:hypothetical protein